MTSLISNRIKFELIIQRKRAIYCSKSEGLFRLKYKYFLEKLNKHKQLEEFNNWFGNYDKVAIENQPFVYFDFQEMASEDNFRLILDEELFSRNFKWHFVKYTLINHFKNKKFLIEPYAIGKDLSVHVFSEPFNNEWDAYSRYDFIIKAKTNELIFNKNRENVLISNSERSENSFTDIEFTRLRAIDPKTQLIKKIKFVEQRPLRIVANNNIRKQINAFSLSKKISYKKLYYDIKLFYSKYLLDLKTDSLKIQSGGFLHVPKTDVSRVYYGNNLMVFKDNKTNINAVTGMRDYGPFNTSPIAKDVEFIFIYENSDDANKLYQYFKNGLKHFPGLQSYVGISPTLSDLKLKYQRKNLKETIDKFLSEKLSDNNYEHYFVILIGPFKKGQQSEDLNKLYYYTKKQLLKKSISSQFIYYKDIRSNYFHFYLPNIAIAILAKLGGIPWRLKEESYKELIIGFNTKKINDNRYIGSAVFFDNQGYLKKVNSYERNNLNKIANDLKETIEAFKRNNSEELKRVIIHTYKPLGKAEREIERLLREKLKLDIPLIYIEINDTKTTAEICFEEDYDYGMPVSGTYVRTRRNEYLLFNNTRYHKKPLRSVTEEWPIKLRIYADNNRIFAEKQLISQVYEFSRLYWKGLKQRSQPVTTIYSKLIADYAGNFGKPIPKNKIAQGTPWFL